MSSLALYRRYRPETFAEVIGQEHVTGPLQQALRNNRVNHAYLFSGPRGCGKTTSARILARCLNCVQGPTPTPCGECQSCRDLARNGPGSIDVIEIDAASHGGVDDARELREKAFFGPASSRYKIYIIDEAHMVTSAGFNALLKVVEEPPEHLKFIFATTEPEKVIGTIRSRTHHYPFRLVPPGTLRDYLAEVCEHEAIPVEDGVLPLVVRAGAGSVRDSMSVMDQLLAGAGEDGVTYAMATALLGYTDGSLLDGVVDAFAAGDGGAAFEVVDRVIEGGNDPRRFVADLLERLRDLVILAAVPDAAEKGLIDAPADVIERMQAQASVFGAAELSRAADLVNEGLTEMRGATSPRLQLELICARVLLPAAFDDERSVQARLDRLERGAALAGGLSGAGAGPAMGYVPGPDAHAAPPQAAAGPTGPAAARAALPPRGAAAGGATAGGAAAAAGAQPPAGPEAQPPVEAGAAGQAAQGAQAWPAGAQPGTPAAGASPGAGQQPSGQGGEGAEGPGGQRPGAWPGAGPADGPAGHGGPSGGAGMRPGAWPAGAQSAPAQSAGAPGGDASQQAGGTGGDNAAAQQPGAWPAGGSQTAGAPAGSAAGGGGQRPGAWPGGSGASSGGASDSGAPAAQSGRPAQPTQPAPTPSPAAGGPAQGALQIRQMWPDILEAVKNRRRFTWILLSQNAQVAGFDGTTLQLAFSNAGARDSFVGGGSEDVLRQALSESLGVQWKIEAIVDPSGGAAAQGGAPAGPRPSAPAPQPPPAARPAAPQSTSAPAARPAAQASAPEPRPRPEVKPHREPEPPPVAPEDDMPAEDDPDLDDTALSGHDLIVRELGATVLEEYTNE
ncbi:DNA polymerase III subunit gamma and tau [Streptomyces sp. 7N604]|uniref:DNA polymerase III subunit gamma and tau n=1 Tax=Streptomyces sp. 7N604 TaxID=3457415 RepID=UPI003FD62DC5